MRALVCGVAKKAIFVLTFSEGISIGGSVPGSYFAETSHRANAVSRSC